MIISRAVILSAWSFFVLLYPAACSGQPQASQPSLMAAPIQTPQHAPTLEPNSSENLFSLRKPNGVLTADDQASSWIWRDASGIHISKLEIQPGLAAEPDSIHITGQVSGSDRFPAVITRTWLPQQAIISLSGGQTVTIRATESFVALAGKPGQPIVAFTEISYENDIVQSRLYAAHISDLGRAAPVMVTAMDMPGFAPVPLAVESADRAATTVWYTLSAWDTRGEDMVFPLSLGLFSLDPASGLTEQLLDLDRNLQGQSPDHSLAASVSAGYDNEKSLQVHQLPSGQTVQFDLKPESNLGAGYAVFSPQSQYVAWLEAGGSVRSDSEIFSAQVRTGNPASTQVLHEVDLSAARAAAGFEQAAWMQPVGWLDENQLLIQVYDLAQLHSALVRLNMADGSLSAFCPGRFLGFTYP